jgi:hypothetical protein
MFQGQPGSDLTLEYRRHIYGLRLHQNSALHLRNSRSSGHRKVSHRRTFGIFRDFFRDFGPSEQGKGAWPSENFFRANARKKFSSPLWALMSRDSFRSPTTRRRTRLRVRFWLENFERKYKSPPKNNGAEKRTCTNASIITRRIVRVPFSAPLRNREND